MDTTVLLGNRIRQARESRGLSQEKLAELIEKDQRAVSEYENGKRRLAVADLPRLAIVLDVPLMYFFDDIKTDNDLDSEILLEFHRLPDRRSQEAAIGIIRTFSDVMQFCNDPKT